ncbi:hypothetical protein LK08_30555 [Streptomyces sp. MUSC 125]|nr:hypothetical protein LK08_30555 [Streptomyces sp. MUSC 125]
MAGLEREEALKLLGTVPWGRLAFSHQALPAIRPAHHLVDDGDIVIRMHEGAALLGRVVRSEVVAYQADEIDPGARTGWNVVVTGTATEVLDAVELARYQGLLTPWIRSKTGQVVRIRPEIVDGYRLVRAEGL